MALRGRAPREAGGSCHKKVRKAAATAPTAIGAAMASPDAAAMLLEANLSAAVQRELANLDAAAAAPAQRATALAGLVMLVSQLEDGSVLPDGLEGLGPRLGPMALADGSDAHTRVRVAAMDGRSRCTRGPCLRACHCHRPRPDAPPPSPRTHSQANALALLTSLISLSQPLWAQLVVEQGTLVSRCTLLRAVELAQWQGRGWGGIGVRRRTSATMRAQRCQAVACTRPFALSDGCARNDGGPTRLAPQPAGAGAGGCLPTSCHVW